MMATLVLETEEKPCFVLEERSGRGLGGSDVQKAGQIVNQGGD